MIRQPLDAWSGLRRRLLLHWRTFLNSAAARLGALTHRRRTIGARASCRGDSSQVLLGDSTISTIGARLEGLPTVIEMHLREELGSRGERVVEALRTASHLLAEARIMPAGLRLVESAAYNVREALDAVVVGRDPAGVAGFAAVKQAWEQYRVGLAEATDDSSARRLLSTIEALVEDQDQQAYRTQQLLRYVVEQTGIGPLEGAVAPTIQYQRLREQAASTLHDRGALADVASLHQATIAWFVRFFTPPDDRLHAIAGLASEPYGEPRQLARLVELAYNAHHLSLFMSEVRDPAWLDALFGAGVIGPPREGEPWPVAFLIDGAGGIATDCVATLLLRVVDATSGQTPRRRLEIARAAGQAASRLGPAGHAVTERVVEAFPRDPWVQGIAAATARAAQPEDDIVRVVADAVVGNESGARRGQLSRPLLDHLIRGMTAENASVRVALVTYKLRAAQRGQSGAILGLDIVSLTMAGDHLRDQSQMLAHQLVSRVRGSSSIS